MHPALGGANIICKARLIPISIRYILKRYLDLNVLLFLVRIENTVVNCLVAAIQIRNERPKAALEVKGLRRYCEMALIKKERRVEVKLLAVRPCVDDHDPERSDEICLLAEVLDNPLPVKRDLFENLRVRL